MTAVLKSITGISVAESVLNDIISRNSKYYYYMGKVLSWNPNGIDAPETPLENHRYEMATRSQIISTKRITESDASFVIPRYDWKTNTVYDMYDDNYSLSQLSASGASSLDTAIYYVVTDEFNVYKCIFNNNNKVSIVKPTGVDASIFTTSDGYDWKFLFNIPIGFRNKFLLKEFIPVTTAIRTQFYSKGMISSVTIDTNGSGYVQGSTSILVTGDGYIEDNPFKLLTIGISSGGFGYSTTPIATISAPLVTIGAKVQATATLTRTATVVSSGTLTIAGYGYTDAATITIAEPITAYTDWVSGLSVTVNQKIKYLNNYYNVTTAGSFANIPPTHTTGSQTYGTAVLAYTASRAIAYLTFAKTEAIINPIVSGGQIVGVSVLNSGIGYTNVSLIVQGVGSGAKLSVNLSSGDLNTLQANIELLAVNGEISNIKVQSQGNGYSASTVVISGDGIGATAVAITESGKIVNIIFTNRGSGYTFATASIVGTGSGCVLRCIMSPIGGHGKNAVLELNAKTLMFFSSISSEKNQGITVNNDTRQIGIIKSLNRFGSDLTFSSGIGSACYLLTTTIAVDPVKFYPDLQINTGAKQYYVVSVEGNKILINSPFNDIPILGETVTSINNDKITPSSITLPSIDKYSGNMLFIDNRNAFNTSANQSLSLRTTISF